MTNLCEDGYEPFTGPYYLDICMISVVALLQLLLFVHTGYHEITLRGDKAFQKVQRVRILYIGCQIVALAHVTADLARYFLGDSWGCRFVSYFMYENV